MTSTATAVSIATRLARLTTQMWRNPAPPRIGLRAITGRRSLALRTTPPRREELTTQAQNLDPKRASCHAALPLTPGMPRRPAAPHDTLTSRYLEAVTVIHHVQLACPPGSEPALREFYAGVLGLTELAKPPVLATRGGCWFRGHGIELHLGVEQDFRPARKAPPGLLVEDLDAWAARLRAAGCPVAYD